jgi:hypothetical protein
MPKAKTKKNPFWNDSRPFIHWKSKTPDEFDKMEKTMENLEKNANDLMFDTVHQEQIQEMEKFTSSMNNEEKLAFKKKMDEVMSYANFPKIFS